MLNMSESAKVIDVVLDGTGGRARTLVNRPGTLLIGRQLRLGLIGARDIDLNLACRT